MNNQSSPECQPAPAAVTGWRFVIRALRYRNFRLFFGGQGISLIGTWIQQIALGWLVYRLTDSAFLLGLVGFTGQIPTFLISSFAGVIADRMDRRSILVATQTLAMLQAFILAFLTLTKTATIWHIVPLALFLGCVNAFDIPTRQSFFLEMIEKKEDLGNAIALNSSMFNSARLIGPAIAGLLIVLFGEGICFFINALSYIPVIAALLMMRIPRKEKKPEKSPVYDQLKEGFIYAYGFAPIRSILLFLSLVSFMGMSYTVLMPVFARDILHGGPHVYGFLMTGTGIGALAGALLLASRKSVLGLGDLIVRAGLMFGLGVIAFAFSSVLWLSFILLIIAGFGMMVQMASSNTVLQTIVDDDKRGRVMSFYTMAFMGMTPFGSLMAGILADKIGAQHTLLVSGVGCILGAILFARKLPKMREIIHPIYEKMGLYPETAGVQAASELCNKLTP
jgi:MFS family permease